MCAACGLVQNFWQLLIARVLLGVGEAGASPPSHALLAETFPPAKRATALGIYTLGSPLGLLIGFGIGGALADAYGWRMVLLIFGLPGLVLAAAIFKFLPEPPRMVQTSVETSKTSVWPSLLALARIPTLWHATLASATSSMAWVSVLLWAAAYFGRAFDLSLTEIGFRLSVVMSVSQAIALVLAGVIADRLGKRDRRWYMWYGCGIVVLAAPFFAAIFQAGTPGLAQLALFGAFLFANMQTACSLAVVQFVAGSKRRALASACYLFLVNILSSLGPLAVGILSDLWSADLGTAALGRALTVVSVTAALWCGLHGWWGGRSLPKDFEAADRAV